MPRAASAGRSAASSRTVSSAGPNRRSAPPGNGRRGTRTGSPCGRATVGPCSASPVHRSFGASASNRPNACGGCPFGAGGQLQAREVALQGPLVRRPAGVRPQDRRDLRRGPLGHLLLQRDRQVQHLGRGARRRPRRGRDQGVEPAAAPVPDPPVDRGPRHPHRLPERAVVLRLREGPDQPAPLPGRQLGSAASRISEYRNSPTARARSARTRSSSWPNATYSSFTPRESCTRVARRR